MSVRIYVSRDASAQALGADETVAALQVAAAARGIESRSTRVGSRGMVWLEPLVEVEVDGGRIAYGPVTAAEVSDSLRPVSSQGARIALRLGRVEDLPWFAQQERLTFARVGVIDPVNVDDYLAHDGYAGLRARSR